MDNSNTAADRLGSNSSPTSYLRESSAKTQSCLPLSARKRPVSDNCPKIREDTLRRKRVQAPAPPPLTPSSVWPALPPNGVGNAISNTQLQFNQADQHKIHASARPTLPCRTEICQNHSNPKRRKSSSPLTVKEIRPLNGLEEKSSLSTNDKPDNSKLDTSKLDLCSRLSAHTYASIANLEGKGPIVPDLLTPCSEQDFFSLSWSRSPETPSRTLSEQLNPQSVLGLTRRIILSPLPHFSHGPPLITSRNLRTPSPHKSVTVRLPLQKSDCLAEELPNEPELSDVVEKSSPIKTPGEMATSSLVNSPGDQRRQAISPRPSKGRENARSTVCRNIGIYGHCRFQNESCLYYHPPTSGSSSNSTKAASSFTNSARLNYDSPTFQPLQPSTNGTLATRTTAISPRSINASPFVPKTNSSTPQLSAAQPSAQQTDWTLGGVPDFVPSNYDVDSQGGPHNADNMMNAYDSFSIASSLGLVNTHPQAPLNPYAPDPTALAGAAYYQNQGTFAQPAQYHNYAPLAPHRENLQSHQRTAHDFFIPDKLREDLQRKSEATWQTLPTSSLPMHVAHYHSLVPLDTNNQRNTSAFGYASWSYKATSDHDGKVYTLRRLEGYRLSTEKAFNTLRAWKGINHGNIVTIHEAWTTREFGDGSLIFVTDYHPNSKTLGDAHIRHAANSRFPTRSVVQQVAEPVLWSYIVQIASALRTIHSSGLAARSLIPSKILLTSENRIRLNGCGILDVVKFDANTHLAELQHDDLVQFGQLILSVASNSNALLNQASALEHLARNYPPRINDIVLWLLDAKMEKSIDNLLHFISGEVVGVLDAHLHAEDTLTSTLMGETESSRLLRLVAKLGLINERPEFQHNPTWSESGERYQLKMFRDYVFHAVDEKGLPVTDLGHILTCLNKLDAGSLENVQLVSRDEQTVFVVTYRDLKKSVETCFNELGRGRGGR